MEVGSVLNETLLTKNYALAGWWIIYCASLLLRNAPLIRFQPSMPTIARPAYCVVLAIPKSTNHNTPFNAGEIGSAICANESI